MPDVKTDYEAVQVGDILLWSKYGTYDFWKVIKKTKCYVSLKQCKEEEYRPDEFIGKTLLCTRTFKIKEPNPDTEVIKLHISKCHQLYQHYEIGKIFCKICVNKVKGDKIEVNDIIQYNHDYSY